MFKTIFSFKTRTVFQKGCPGCGFSYCPKCLKEKVFLQKVNSECKVCLNCKRKANENQKTIDPPAAYYKRIGAVDNKNEQVSSGPNFQLKNPIDQEILDRLEKLKQDKQRENMLPIDALQERLQKLKGDVPSTSDAELEQRLANIKGVPVTSIRSKPVIISPDLRSEQEQANDLIKQYVEQESINAKYKEEFDGLVGDIEARLQKLKGASSSGNAENKSQEMKSSSDYFELDEEETIKKILEKAKKEAILESDAFDETKTDELPFCEICNEDARMRCLGCKYLFCKQCFMEHRDEDDGCDKYEPYTPPKSDH